MAKKDFTTSLVLEKSSKDVFAAINRVNDWWSGEVKGNTGALTDEFSYRVSDVHYSLQKIVEFEPNKKVVWLVTESNLSFTSNKSEWTGTKIKFELSETNGKTTVLFTHEGLVPSFECYGGCSNAWTQLIQESLFSLITSGKGKKIF
jgi:hypothetical protein